MKHAHVLCPALLLTALCALGACATAPTLSAGTAAASPRNEQGQEIVLTLQVHNESAESIPLRTVHYTLSLDGVTVFTGVRAAEATLSPNEIRPLRLPAVVPANAAVAAGEKSYRLTGTLTYLTPGALSEALYDLNLRVPTQSFAVEGEIAIP